MSPTYSIVRFKNSNVFLNEIIVEKRDTELKKVTLERKIEDTDPGEFKRERSVFKTYQEDCEDLLKAMLSSDLKFSKISRLCRQDSDREALAACIEKHYLRLKNIFLFYVAKSESYPTIGMKDFTSFCYRSKILDRNLNLATMDRLFITTNVSNNPFKNSSERLLHRYEFLEMICRLAQAKYKEQKGSLTMAEAFGK